MGLSCSGLENHKEKRYASIMRVLRSAECGTDHFMVRGKFKFRIQKKSRMTGVQLPNVSILLSRATEFQDVTTPSCSQVNLRKSHEVGTL